MRRGILFTAVAFALLVGTAQANTVLHVNGATGADTGNCQSTPCKTIGYAVTQGRAVPDLITIDASAGTYAEDLSLGAMDSGLTIIGAGSGSDPSTDTVITGVSGNPGINTAAAGDASSLKLEHLRLVTPSGDNETAIAGAATDLDLNDVAIDSVTPAAAVVLQGDVSVVGGSITNTDPIAGPLLDTGNGAVTVTDAPITLAGSAPAILGIAVSLTGSPVTLTNTTAGAPAVIGTNGPVSLNDSPIDIKGNGSAIQAPGAITVTNSQLTLEGAAGSTPAINAVGPFAAVSVTGSPIIIDGPAMAIDASSDPAVLSNVQITLNDAANSAPALMLAARGSSLSHVTIGGAWAGSAIVNKGSLDVTDSSLTSGPASAAPVIQLTNGGSSGHTVSIVRSTVKQRSTTVPAISATNVSAAVVSSELLGGGTGFAFTGSGGSAQALTIASSTIDAGTLGVRDASPVASVAAIADNTAGSAALVNVQGSILVEPPAATRGGTSGSATVNCEYTEVPSTTQAPSATNGAINCGATSGNTSTASLSSIFANPATGYTLNPSWSGVDSVPNGAISLPAPFTDSSTDLVGDPRVLNGLGGCSVGLRDKGAVELTGHAGIVPQPVIGGPSTVSTSSAGKFKASAPNVHGLTVSFSWHASDGATGAGSSFSHRFSHTGKQSVTLSATGAPGCTGSTTKKVTAERPATITGLKISPRKFKRSGHATVSYRDSMVATATLTIQRKSGKHYKKVRSFTHRDRGGKVKVRLNGTGLAKGTYRLQVVAKNSVGTGPAAFASFTVTG